MMTLRELIVQVTGISPAQTVLDLDHPILAYELAPVAELRLGYKRLVEVKLSDRNKANRFNPRRNLSKMNSEQLQELAINALLDHWPPHLGVQTEAEKVEYLVHFENQIEVLGNETVDLENKLAARDIKIEQLEGKIERLNGKIVDLQERCTELGERQ
jgi:hypothetical protein